MGRWLLALWTVFSLTACPATAAQDGDRLLWLVRTPEGTVLSARGADTPCNPASVLKLGTALFVLDRLGPGHRYETTFAITGTLDHRTGVLSGDIVVLGGGDPDFQPENAWLVARGLARAGIRTVAGDLVVSGRFWMGWDHGVEGTRGLSPDALRLRAGRRLRNAWDPSRWSAAMRQGWLEWIARHPTEAGAPPRLPIEGTVRTGEAHGRPLFRHRSNPLLLTLRRFLTYSNNDIVRLVEPLGGAPVLQRYLAYRLDAPPGTLTVAAASGEGPNRLTPRLGVALLDVLRRWLLDHGLTLRDLLPVPGCVPGPLPRMFPHLASPPLAGAVACKTGTLATTDGGVAVLAGAVTTRKSGQILFFVAAPEAGNDLRRWRRVEQRWLEECLDALGGAVTAPCPPPLPWPDDRATVEPAG